MKWALVLMALNPHHSFTVSLGEFKTLKYCQEQINNIVDRKILDVVAKQPAETKTNTEFSLSCQRRFKL